MTKLEFVNQLESRLGGIPKDERNGILEYYVEIINDKLENGESEDSILQSLGSPETIARNILSENDMPPIEAVKPLPVQKSRSVGRIIGFSFLLPLVIFMLAMWGIVVLSFLFVALALALGGVGYFVSSFFLFVQDFWVGLFQIGIGLVTASISIFVGCGSWRFAKLYGRTVVKMFKKYKRIYGGKHCEKN